MKFPATDEKPGCTPVAEDGVNELRASLESVYELTQQICRCAECLWMHFIKLIERQFHAFSPLFKLLVRFH